MRIFKTRVFSGWARKERISDQSLRLAVKEMELGLFDVSLGNGIYKKRVPVQGRGKSGGARTILAYKSNKRAFFMYGFLKSDKSNISQKELCSFRGVASDLILADELTLKRLLVSGKIKEISHGSI